MPDDVEEFKQPDPGGLPFRAEVAANERHDPAKAVLDVAAGDIQVRNAELGLEVVRLVGREPAQGICLGPGEGLQAIHQFHLRQAGLGLRVGGHLVQGLPVGGGRGRVVAGLDRIERRLVQRRQRRRLRFRATRAAGADPSGHAVGGRDLEKFIEQAAYLLFVRAALEERHGLALDHRDGGRHGLHLERLGKFREHVDVRGPEDQPAVVALDDAFKDVHQLAGAWRIGGPEGDHHGHLGREVHELLEVALGHVHAQRPACVVGRAGCRGRRGTGRTGGARRAGGCGAGRAGAGELGAGRCFRAERSTAPRRFSGLAATGGTGREAGVVIAPL